MRTNFFTKQIRIKPAGTGFLRGLAALLLISLFWTTGAKAQLSGTYTICPSGCNYSTIGAAITDLKNKGISAAVTFNVSAATYSENPTINQAITGASATNTITFQGAGRGKSVITSSSTVLTLQNTSWITFTGFSFTCTSTSYSVYSYFTTNCTVAFSDLSTSNSCCAYCVYDYYTKNWTVMNCHISGGYYCLYIYSSPGSTTYNNNLYKNNRIVNFGYYGGLLYYTNQAQYVNNVIDSTANGYGYGFLSEYESGALYSGNQVVAPGLYYPMYCYGPNQYNTANQYKLINNFFANYQYYGYFFMYYSSNVLIAHNTFYGNSANYAAYFYMYYSGNKIDVISNIFQASGASYAAYFYFYGVTFPAPFGVLDGNCYLNGTGALVYLNTSYATLAALQSGLSTYTYTSPYDGRKGSFEQFANTTIPTYINPPKNLHVNQTKVAPSGVYAGVDVDIDGDSRCKLFPTCGADESTFGKSKPTVKFFLPSNIYPGSPTFIYQTAKAGEPKIHAWYLNGVKVSDSVVLKTSAFLTGSNTLKLVTKTCAGNDSFTATFNVAAPTAVPGTDFIANKNTIQAGQVISFTDLSSNGPTKWLWAITPDSTLSGGVKVPTVKYVFGSNTYQNPQVRFDYGGKYKVCMTATNGVGKGATVCKTNYINVIPVVSLKPGTQTTQYASGYLFDNGGPNAGYTYDSKIESIVIDPCADSVYLTFSMFDTYCGYDFVRLYSGRDNSGKPLWSSKCSSTGSAGYGPGYTGGKSVSCSYTCLPDVVKPDTFRAKGQLYLEMNCIEPYYPAGFAAYWWSKPKTSTKPKASFVSSNAGDSVCTNAALNFTNTTKIDPNDPSTFLWDLDGDLTTFECIGTCASSSYPYFLSGPVKVTLIATNCGGSDTATRTLTVYNPKSPKAAFTVDNVNATTNDFVFFTSTVPQCVDDYKWTITKNGTTNTSFAKYVNGTSNLSANPVVNFTDTGWYDVKMYVDNASGAQRDSITKIKMIHVRNAYCIPNVAILNAGIGISQVVFNTISNKTVQAATDYSNFTTNSSLSTSIAIGATYSITISRDPSLIFEAINRDVYIDWNQDGGFGGKGEIVATDSNSYSSDFTAKITVPKTAKTGATIMRIAVNRGSYSNKPCGANEFGEYQDYRIYVTPYNILPVIVLTGHQGLKDTIKLEQGNTFVEPGYKATSFLYGDITKNVVITNPLNNVVPGNYVIKYDVTDSAGNKAVTQVRVIQVTKDATAPALIVDKPDTTIIEVTKLPMHPVPVPKVISADDLVDGPLAGSVVIDSAKVQTNIVGTYVVSYTVTDLSGNTATVYRVVKVIDSIAPEMKLIGTDPTIVEVNTSYTDQGVSVSDNYNTAGELNPLVVVTSTVDITKVGTYLVTYNVKDLAGNSAATLTRTVKVVDTIPPTLTLNGAQSDSIDVFKSYNDPGVTVSDNYDNTGDITITITGTFYSNFPGGKNPKTLGSYTIIYTATDKSGNKSIVTRTVKVVDHVAPVISLLGDAALSVCRWFPYVDAGYSLSDNYYANNKITVTTEGTFITQGGTTMWGLLTLRYKAVDGSNNVGYSTYRFIEVKHETDFTCVNAVNTNLNLDKYISVYPNPNTGMFTVNSNLPAQEKVRMSITNLLGQEIEVVHNGILGQNSFQVDMSSQPSGVYLLNIVTNNQTLTKRIEITR
jgi:PKD repeat protein